MPKLAELSAIFEASAFAGIEMENIAKLASILEFGQTKAGEFVYQMGDPRALYIVVSGRVEICDPMKHTVLKQLSKGDAFGMLALMFNCSVSPEARAVEDTSVLVLDSGTLRMLEVSDPSLAIVVLRCVRKVMGELMSQLSPVIMRMAL